MQLSIYFKHKLSVLIIFLTVVNSAVFAQDRPIVKDTTNTKVVKDSTSTTFSFKDLSLPDPDSIESRYEYDPKIDRYKYTHNLDKYSIRYPMYLTIEQFQELIRKEQIRDYFKEKSEAISGKGETSEEDKKNLLPIYYLNSSFFETVFGSNEIEIIPQGSVEVDLGILYNKQDNPSFSPRNQSNFTFDFDQRISLSLQGNIGTRMSVLANYDTESTFDFQNQLKLQYNPTEDDIIQAIEVGNVSMPLNSSLIQGAQSLFGVKADLQFGKTSISAVISDQRSDTRNVTVQGGGTVEEFEVFALDYDEDRHYFLSHYFREHYDESLEQYPFINSNIQITRIQVWVTNSANNASGLTNTRNIVALQDLGEINSIGITDSGFVTSSNELPDNANNKFDPDRIDNGTGFLNTAVRDVGLLNQAFSVNVEEGLDYSKLENARLLTENQYDLNTQLGYISLNQRLNNDEILGVAFQYTKGGQIYQVGEFANDGVSSTNTTTTNTTGTNDEEEVSSTQAIVVKLLKSSITSVDEPVWDLMMKNIYSLGAFGLSESDFTMNILYTDPSPVNYIKDVESGEFISTTQNDETPTLLKLFHLDRLNANDDPISGGDGFFDYYPGLTVDTENGRIIFAKVEPFGLHLFDVLSTNSSTENYDDDGTYNLNQQEYVFNKLYSETKTQAEQSQASKNKFQLKGKYTTSSANGISIGAFNIPRGSVTVTAGGRVLLEGVDYTVNYQLGRVEILDEALLASNTPIDISTENNAVFGQQSKRYIGVNVEHQFSEDFMIGGTVINMRERPLTQKSSYSFEPINNTIVGLNANYATEVPFLTRMVNKLPNIDTEAPSRFSFRGEFAYLFANAPDAADFDGEVTSYLDDFEAAQTSINMSSPLSWELSSVPENFEGADDATGLSNGYNRAGLSWYTIDPTFYTSSAPSGIDDMELSRPQSRLIPINEIFAEEENDVSQTNSLFTLNLFYRPQERGSYNYNPNFDTSNFDGRFAGITRGLTTTDFEQSNIEFIEFWIMDPYQYTNNTNVGEIRFNIGNISEDVLADNRKQFENGLPEEAIDFTPGGIITSTYRDSDLGRIPTNQSLIYAFDNEGGARTNQDAGFDGLKDAQELQAFGSDFGDDPSNDNYQYFLQAGGNIEERYLKYNGTDGDSPVEVTDDNRGRTSLPTVEDVNRDNTMNTIDQYYEYTIDISPEHLNENNPLITDIVENNAVSTPDGGTTSVRWLQFRVPLSDASIERFNNNQGETLRTESENAPSDLRSANFMRMYMTGFNENILLRLATLDLVRGDYRTYAQTPGDGIDTNGLNVKDTDGADTNGTVFSVTLVSLENNSEYILPPGVEREELNTNNNLLSQDEGSLALTVSDLHGPSFAPVTETGDGRAVYKNFNVDMRQYENLQMFLHAESSTTSGLEDGELSAIMRIGTDFTENFYQIELPLKVSTGSGSADEVWPEENRLDLSLDLLQEVKSRIISLRTENPDSDQYNNGLTFFNEALEETTTPGEVGELKIGIKGSPSYGNVRVVMLGVKNNTSVDDSKDVSGQVWFNEMRLSGLKNQGGWAAVANMDANIADFATVTASGRRSTIGFGSVEQGPIERSTEDIAQYDFTTSVNVGQLLPKKWGIKVPVTYSRSEELITPQYDPLNDDLLLENVLSAADPEDKNAIEEQSTEYTKRQSISVIGLRKERLSERKPMPYDIENFSASGTYNQTDYRDFEIEESVDQSLRLSGTYNYTFAPLSIEPLKKAKFLENKKHLRLLKDINVNLLPTNISASTGLNRSYNLQEFRDVTLSEESIQTPALINRNYLFDWQYGIQYNLTKSLNFNFTSAINRIVTNYLDANDEVIDDIGIWDGLTNLGEANTLSQSLQANYELPFKKIPLLSFVKSTYSYNGDFQWNKGSDVYDSLVVTDEDGNEEFVPDLGNTVQNSRSHRLNSSLDLKKFYKNVGLVKRTSNRKKEKKKKKDSTSVAGVPKIAPRTAGAKKKKASTKLKPSVKLYNSFIGALTAVEKVSVNYQEDSGTVLPGYTNGIGWLGSLEPTRGFAFGSQNDIRDEAARRGWLTIYDSFNEQYQQRESKNLDFQGTVGLLEGLKIDVSANKSESRTYSENYIIDSNAEYQSLTPNTYGNYNISTILLGTAFQTSTEDASRAFETFKNNRLVIANRLAGPNAVDEDGDGYPDGYGPTNQAVLLPAFLAAYSGQDAGGVRKGAFRDVPLPNWNVKYTGLMKKKWFKKRFKRFSIAHSYRSDYTVNRFQTNLDFDPLATGDDQFDTSGNFKNEILFGNINLTEQFSPLVKFDIETKGSIKVSTEIRKDRALSFSFDNNLLTEVQGSEYVIGLGYRIKDIQFATSLGGDGRRRMIKSDLNLKADLSLRRNETVVRYLDADNSQVTSGQDIYSLRITSDYALSKNLTALFYYDHSFSKFSVSTAFPQTNIRSGFTMRYNFGN